MHKVMNETTSRMRGLISRRMFSQAGIAALSAKVLPRITFGFATADAAAPSSAHGLPTLDEPGTRRKLRVKRIDTSKTRSRRSDGCLFEILRNTVTKTKRKRVKHIALALPLDVVFVERLLPGILEFARSQGGWVFTRVPERLAPSFEWLRNWEGDGAFVLIENKADIRVARSLPMPIVNVGGYVQDVRIPTVTLDQQMVGRFAADHLLARRFHRFGYYGVRDLWYSEQRRIGFEDALRAAGYTSSSMESTGLIGSSRDWRRVGGELARWLRSLRPPVGIMASWDLRAQMLSEACATIGLRVPEDVAIVGVDNDPIACEFCIPQLSSVSRNDRQLGWQAANLLSQLIEGKRPPKTPILIPPDSVVARRSTDTFVVEDPEIAEIVQRLRSQLGEVFGVERMLRLTSLSRRQLEHRFRRSVGSSPYSFLNELRIERAKVLLAEPRKRTLTRVASECGFKELRRFRLVFRRLTKLSPAEYRRSVAAKIPDRASTDLTGANARH